MLTVPLVSIIIPLHWGLKEENFERFCREFKHFLNLSYSNYEILIVVDKKMNLPIPFVKTKVLVINSRHPTSPAEKRDFALKSAKGKICAFIDDDAYPSPDWIKMAVKWFRNPDVIAVGGAGVTPPNDNFWEKIGGYIIESYLCSGGIQHRFYVDENSPPAFVDDWPAYNLLIRSKSLKKVGGFASTFYGGEDTYVCLKLDKIGKMVFEPKAVVYHHRRGFPVAHLKQIRNVGIHRGYFFKAHPETSRRIIYLLPTTITLFLLVGIILLIFLPKLVLFPFTLIFLLSLTVSTISVHRHKTNLGAAVIGGLGIILTHICYGTYFIVGLFTKNLKY